MNFHSPHPQYPMNKLARRDGYFKNQNQKNRKIAEKKKHEAFQRKIREAKAREEKVNRLWRAGAAIQRPLGNLSKVKYSILLLDYPILAASHKSKTRHWRHPTEDTWLILEAGEGAVIPTTGIEAQMLSYMFTLLLQQLEKKRKKLKRSEQRRRAQLKNAGIDPNSRLDSAIAFDLTRFRKNDTTVIIDIGRVRKFLQQKNWAYAAVERALRNLVNCKVTLVIKGKTIVANESFGSIVPGSAVQTRSGKLTRSGFRFADWMLDEILPLSGGPRVVTLPKEFYRLNGKKLRLIVTIAKNHLWRNGGQAMLNISTLGEKLGYNHNSTQRSNSIRKVIKSIEGMNVLGLGFRLVSSRRNTGKLPDQVEIRDLTRSQAEHGEIPGIAQVTRSLLHAMGLPARGVSLLEIRFYKYLQRPGKEIPTNMDLAFLRWCVNDSYYRRKKLPGAVDEFFDRTWEWWLGLTEKERSAHRVKVRKGARVMGYGTHRFARPKSKQRRQAEEYFTPIVAYYLHVNHLVKISLKLTAEKMVGTAQKLASLLDDLAVAVAPPVQKERFTGLSPPGRPP